MKISSVLIVMLLGLTGCQGQVEEKSLLGKWKVTGFETNLPELSPALIEAARVEALSSKYELSPDGKFYMESNFSREGSTGNWSYSADSRTLVFNHTSEGNDTKESYRVESAGSSQMVWTQELEGVGSLSLTLQH